MKALSSEPKGDSKMKRFFVFTLMLLFATTCLFLPNLSAWVDWDSGDIWAGNASGEAYVCAWYSFPFAKSTHWVSLFNCGPVPIRYYYDFYMDVSGPEDIPALQAGDGGWCPINDAWSTSKTFSVNMRHKEEGCYEIDASTDFSIKADFNRDGVFETFGGWNASVSNVDFER